MLNYLLFCKYKILLQLVFIVKVIIISYYYYLLLFLFKWFFSHLVYSWVLDTTTTLGFKLTYLRFNLYLTYFWSYQIKLFKEYTNKTDT